MLYHDAKRRRPSEGGAPSVTAGSYLVCCALLPLAKQMALAETEKERKLERAGKGSSLLSRKNSVYDLV